MALIAGQDVEPAPDSDGTDGRWQIARKVAPDRVISTVDPDSRHAHKTRSRRQDGYKAHILIEPDTGIITDTTLTPAAGAANSDAAVGIDLLTGSELLDTGTPVQVLADSAYANGDALAALQAAGHDAVIKPWPLRAAVAGGFTLDDFTVDERVGTVSCPNQITRPITATRAVVFGMAWHGMTWHVAAARCAPNAPRRLRLLTAAAPARHPAQDAVWARTDAHNKLRSLLREFYPAILAAFSAKRGGLLRPEARALLAAAPTPRAAARLTLSQLRSLLHRAGLQRGLDAEAARLQQVLRADFLHHPSLVEDAFGQQALALLRQLDTACANATDLAAAATERFAQHLDAATITSMPGLAALTGARVLAEIGDDRDRFADARGLKAYARSAPRASGKTTAVLHRRSRTSAGLGWMRLGVRRADRLVRCPRPLRPPQSRRRPAHRRPTQPVQAAPGLPAPLPARQTYDETTAFPTASNAAVTRAA